MKLKRFVAGSLAFIMFNMNLFSYGAEAIVDEVAALIDDATESKGCQTEHSWDEGEVTDATCAEKGKIVYTCTECEETKTETIDKLPHEWNEGEVTTEPTCVETGIKTYTCDGCEEVKTESIKETGHDWDNGEITVAATCKDEGVTTYTCRECEEIKTETIDKLPHEWNNGETTIEATCKDEGVTTYTCRECEETKTETIDKLPHKWNNGETTIEATCKDEGEMTYTCSECEETKTETIDKLPHEWNNGETTIEATCKDEGEMTYTCSECGEIKTEVIEKLSHTFGEGTIIKEVTCKDEGEKEYICSECGEIKTEVIEKLPHTFGEGTILKEVTCKDEGKKEYICSECGEIKTEVIEKLPHTFGEGTTLKEVTCKNEGEITYTCSVCGETNIETINRLSHTWNDGEVTLDATETTAGIKTYTCTVCTEIKTEEIPATNVGDGSNDVPTTGDNTLTTGDEKTNVGDSALDVPATGEDDTDVEDVNPETPYLIINPNGSTEYIEMGELINIITAFDEGTTVYYSWELTNDLSAEDIYWLELETNVLEFEAWGEETYLYIKGTKNGEEILTVSNAYLFDVEAFLNEWDVSDFSLGTQSDSIEIKINAIDPEDYGKIGSNEATISFKVSTGTTTEKTIYVYDSNDQIVYDSDIEIGEFVGFKPTAVTSNIQIVLNELGNYTIRVIDGNLYNDATFVLKDSDIKLEMQTEPQMGFFKGDTFSVAGGKLKLGTTFGETVTAITGIDMGSTTAPIKISDVDTNIVGSQLVAVTYTYQGKEYTVTYEIEVADGYVVFTPNGSEDYMTTNKSVGILTRFDETSTGKYAWSNSEDSTKILATDWQTIPSNNKIGFVAKGPYNYLHVKEVLQNGTDGRIEVSEPYRYNVPLTKIAVTTLPLQTSYKTTQTELKLNGGELTFYYEMETDTGIIEELTKTIGFEEFGAYGVEITSLGENIIIEKDSEITDASQINKEDFEDTGWVEKVIITHKESGFEASYYVTVNTTSYTNGIVNAPDVAEGMLPVKYLEGKYWSEKDSKWIEIEPCWMITTKTDTNWYNYESDVNQWANVMLRDDIKLIGFDDTETVIENLAGKIVDIPGSMFVWIPRYNYTLGEDDEGNSTGKVSGIPAGTITTEINSMTGDSKVEDNAYLDIDWVKGTSGEAHSAFSFGGIELNGFWMSKFEASQNGETEAKIKVIPDAVSWGNMDITTAYNTSREMMNLNKSYYGIEEINIDSHLVKNNEWGAVALLTIATTDGGSSFTGAIPYINNYYIGEQVKTGYSAIYQSTEGATSESQKDKTTFAWNTQEGQKASTTHNIYGVYDMSGGVNELVAGYVNSTEAIVNDTNYWNNVSDYLTNTTAGYAMSEVLLFMDTNDSEYRLLDGDAGKELNSTPTYVLRGGWYSSNSDAGVFSFNKYSSRNKKSVGFRPVIIMTNSLSDTEEPVEKSTTVEYTSGQSVNVGDKLTITITTTEELNLEDPDSYTITIGGAPITGESPQVTHDENDSTKWYIEYVFSEGDTPGQVEIELKNAENVEVNGNVILEEEEEVVVPVDQAIIKYTSNQVAYVGDTLITEITAPEGFDLTDSNNYTITTGGNKITGTPIINKDGTNWTLQYVFKDADTKGQVEIELTGITNVTVNGEVILKEKSVSGGNSSSTSDETTIEYTSNTYAKIGDKLEVKITSDKALDLDDENNYTITVGGNQITGTPKFSGSTTSWTIEYVFQQSDTTGKVEIDLVDAGKVTVDGQVTFKNVTDGNIILLSAPEVLTNGKIQVEVTINCEIPTKVVKYAKDQSEFEYFRSKGTTITNKFSVSENGTYYVYAKDYADNEYIAYTTIEDIDNTPPTIEITQLKSDNAKTNYAQNGDTITIKMSASEVVTKPTVTINGREIDENQITTTDNVNYTVTYTIPSNESDLAEGLLSVSISNYKDNAGNHNDPVTTTEDKNGNTIIYDRVKVQPFISTPNTYSTQGEVIYYKVSFSDINLDETALNITAADFSIEKTGTVNGIIEVVDTDDILTKTVFIKEISGEGTFYLKVLGDNADGHTPVKDMAGNHTAMLESADIINVDTVQPSFTTNPDYPGTASISIKSNNTNTDYATNGNTITLTLKAREKVTMPVVTIMGRTATVETSDYINFTATYKIPDGEIALLENQVWFEISGYEEYSATFNNVGKTHSETTDGTKVIYDRTKPTGIISAPTISEINSKTVKEATYTITYTDDNFDVSTLSESDVVLVKDGTDATITVSGTGNTREVTLSNVSGKGTIGISINVGTAKDKSGNLVDALPTSELIKVDTDIPTIGNVKIESNNKDKKYATNGNTITLTFEANEEIATPIVKIMGRIAAVTNVSNDHKNFEAVYEIPAGESIVTEGSVTFSINYQDNFGNVGTQVTTTNDSSSVYYDRTKPTVTFETNGNKTVLQSHSTKVILSDAHSGLSSQTYYYAWADNNVNEPTYTETFTNGETIEGTGYIGTYYLWIKSISDKAGNESGPVISNAFNFDNELPTITVQSIQSNGNVGYAKNGNTMTVYMTASEAIYTKPTVTVGGKIVEPEKVDWTVGSTTGKATYEIEDSESEITQGLLSVVVKNYKDIANNPGSTIITTTATDGSSVYYDRTKPILSLSPNLNTTASKMHTTVLTVTDAHSGLESNTQYYAWHTSNSAAPAVWNPVSLNSDGTATIEGAGYTGTYYLWIKGAADKAGNINLLTSDVFEFDNALQMLSDVTIISNNSTNTSYATQGDRVIISMTSIEAIHTPPTVTIGGKKAEVNWEAGATTGTAYIDCDTTIPEGVLSLRISGYKDFSGNEGDIVIQTTDNSYVICDRTAPYAMSIIGDNNGAATFNTENSVNLTGKASDNTKIVAYAWTTSSTTPTSDWTTITATTDITQTKSAITTKGAHYFHVKDIAGNTSCINTNIYEMTFDDTEGEGAPNKQYKAHGVDLKLPATVPTRVGYAFDAWRSGGNAVIKQYQPSGIYAQDADTAFVVNEWIPNVINVQINHKLQNANDDGYSLVKTEKLTKAYGAEITFTDHITNEGDLLYTKETKKIQYNGVDYTEATVIVPEDDIIIDILYDRAEYELILELGAYVSGVEGPINTESVVAISTGYRWDEEVTISAEMADSEPGYTNKWVGWTSSNKGLIADISQQNPTIIMPKGNVTLIANATREANTYAVIFNANTGTLMGSSSKTIVYNQAYGDLPLATKTGYQFNGWYTASSGGTEVVASTIANIYTADHSLYAQFTPNTYYVAYDGNGATSGSMSNSTHTYDTDKNLTANEYSRTGYTFNGWKTDDGVSYVNSASVKNLTIENGATVVMHAQWYKDVSITYNGNKNASYIPSSLQGTVSNVPAAQTGLRINAPETSYAATIASGIPTRTGYTFLGWSTSAGAQIPAYTSGGIISLNNDITLYAVWEGIDVTITFDASTNGGEIENTSKVVKYGDYYGDLPTPVKTGYRFTGWYTAASGGTQRQPSSIVSVTSTEKLYAHYEARSYIVLLDAGTNYGLVRSADGTDDEVAAIAATYDNTYGGEAANTSTYSLRSYSPVSTMSTLPTATRTGYTTTGWYTQPTGGSEITDNTTVTVDDDYYSMYAQYEPNTYTITYDKNKPSHATGTVTGTVSNTSHTYDHVCSSSSYTCSDCAGSDVAITCDYISSSKYTLTGWTQIGWNTKADGTGEFYSFRDAGHTTTTEATTLAHGASQTVINLTATDGGSVTLYAVWDANEYTVTFDPRGGEVSPASKVVTYNDSYGTLPTPTRTSADGVAWTFLGWVDEYNNPIIADTQIVIARDHTLYANWERSEAKGNPFVITYIRHGVNPETVEAKYDVVDTYEANGVTPWSDMTVDLQTATREGVEFKGWATAERAQAAAVTIDYPTSTTQITIDQNITLYAVWEIDLSFVAHGGSAPSDITLQGTVEEFTFDLSEPDRDGVDFIGWVEEEVDPAVGSYTGTIHNGSITIKVDDELYALWEMNLSFVANGGSAPSDITLQGTAEYFTFGLDAASRSGVEFLGWTTDPNGTSAEYTTDPNGPNEGKITISSDTTLYAVWEIDLTYVANGGTAPSAETQRGTAVNFTFGLDAASRSGVEFLGWTTDPNGTSAEYTTSITISSDTTLYAVWEIDLTYVANGGTAPSAETQTGTAVNFTFGLDTASRSGVEFLGWTTDPNGTSAEYTTDPNGPNEGKITISSDTTLYAVWKITLTYNVTHALVSGLDAQTLQGTAIDFEFTPLSEPTNFEGFVHFLGWTTDPNGTSEEYTTSIIISSNTTLYSVWRIYVSYYVEGGDAPDAQFAQGTSGWFEFTLSGPSNYGNKTFLGWLGHWLYQNEQWGATKYQSGETINLNTNSGFHAIWDIYLSYKDNSANYPGFDVDKMEKFPPDDKGTGPYSSYSVSLPSAEHDDYYFIGWSIDADTTAEYAAGDPYPLSSHTTLYAVWEIKCTHDNKEWTPIDGSNCKWVCKDCGYEGTGDHDWKMIGDVDYKVEDATCTQGALYGYVCGNCGYFEENDTWREDGTCGTPIGDGPLGHDWGDWSWLCDASVGQYGLSWSESIGHTKARTCARCDETEAIKEDCSYSGPYYKYENDEHHIEFYQCQCGGVSDNTNGGLAHQWAQIERSDLVYSSATCTSGTAYYYECSLCGTDSLDTWRDDDALGHNWVESEDPDLVYSSATCTQGTQYYKYCDRCSDRWGPIWEANDATGHIRFTYFANSDGSSYGYTQTYASGHKVYCADCDVLINATEQCNYGSAHYEYYDLDNCLYLRSCSDCGGVADGSNDWSISGFGHDWQSENNAMTCSRCNHTHHHTPPTGAVGGVTVTCTECGEDYYLLDE